MRARQLGSLVDDVSPATLGLTSFRKQLETFFSTYAAETETKGYPVWHERRVVGSIRSGSIAPSVDNKNIATGLVEKSAATDGARLEVEIRGAKHEATVVPLPFYKRAK